VGRDSSVGIATRYELEGLRIRAPWVGGARFSTHFQTGTWAHPGPCTIGTGSFRGGVKRPGRGVDHPPTSSVDVKERVKLYVYSPSGSKWPLLGWTLPFLFLSKGQADESWETSNKVMLYRISGGGGRLSTEECCSLFMLQSCSIVAEGANILSILRLSTRSIKDPLPPLPLHPTGTQTHKTCPLFHVRTPIRLIPFFVSARSS